MDAHVKARSVSRFQGTCNVAGRRNGKRCEISELNAVFFVRMQMRSIMYLFCAASEDENVQKKGIVCVVMTTSIGPKSSRVSLDAVSAVKIPLLVGVFPVRVDAANSCLFRK
jgi:hypothetical protein